MSTTRRSAVCLALLAAGCGLPPAAPADATPSPEGQAAPPSAPLAPASPPAEGKLDLGLGADGAGPRPGGPKGGIDQGLGVSGCRLPAPRKSDDACTTDADCGPSAPCHAPACVARAKSQPAGPDTMCTKSLECDTADANRCGCYEGRCALIPPSP